MHRLRSRVQLYDACVAALKPDVAVTKVKGRVGKELKCSAELTFGLAPFPDPALRVHMDAKANEIGFPLQAIMHD